MGHQDRDSKSGAEGFTCLFGCLGVSERGVGDVGGDVADLEAEVAKTDDQGDEEEDASLIHGDTTFQIMCAVRGGRVSEKSP